MGRHRTRFQNFIDLKPKAFCLFRGLRAISPPLASGLSFYPELAPPSTDKLEILEERIHPSAALSGGYEHHFEFMSQHNIDTLRPAEPFREPMAAKRIIALVQDCLILGHTMVPTDPATGKGVSLTGNSQSNWNFAFPTLPLKTIRRSGTVFVCPNYKNYYHILVDILFPLYYALITHGDRLPKPLTVVTPKSITPMLEQGIAVMRSWAPDLEHIRLSPLETVRAEHLLYARVHAANSELTFAFPEVAEPVKQAFMKFFSIASQPVSQKIFLYRGNTRLRKVEGEDQLADILKRNGFTIFAPKWENFAEQIARFMAAKVIVGAHGAGLTNVVWGGPQTTLFEIMAENARKRTYLHMAAEVGAKYTPVCGSLEGEQLAFAIDPKKVAKEILSASG